jgi:hypothetical protein
MTESNVSGRRDPMEWIMVDTIEIGSSARAHHFRHLGAHMAASWSRHDAELHLHQATHCPYVPLLQMIDEGLFPRRQCPVLLTRLPIAPVTSHKDWHWDMLIQSYMHIAY